MLYDISMVENLMILLKLCKFCLCNFANIVNEDSNQFYINRKYEFEYSNEQKTYHTVLNHYAYLKI